MTGYFREIDTEWFLIPSDMLDEWEELVEPLDDEDSESFDRDYQKFVDTFGRYGINGNPMEYEVTIKETES